MTFLTIATLLLSIAYFAVCLVARVHDCWVECHRQARPAMAAPATFQPVASFEVVTTGYQGDMTEVEPAPAPKPATAPETLSDLGIRQLKKLASQAGIKGYSNMRKHELIAALG